MKKMLLILVILVAVMFVSCPTVPKNPGKGPAITVAMPELYSPDPDKANDPFVVPITVKHSVPLKDWTITVSTQRQSNNQNSDQSAQRQTTEPRQPRPPFYTKSGEGRPPAKWEWNGKNTADNRAVQSMSQYKFTLTVNDIFDNSSVYEGTINVDLLVIRDGDVLRIIVPSIGFPANSSDFKLLTPEVTRANTRILGVIARSLTKFGDYKITVEGHANPTTAPNTAARRTEETKDLQPLSLARAKAVVDFLVANNNIDRGRLTAVGLGGTKTVAEYNDLDENWQNRRVEFILKK